MSLQGNRKTFPRRRKALARRVFDEIRSQGKLELADECSSRRLRRPPRRSGRALQGPAGAKEFIGRLRERFPNISSRSRT
jgi:hypothetical protein